MAKELPYFKFTVADWLTGDIVFESYQAQGLFINICAIYWQREGDLSLTDINKRFKNPVELSDLIDRFLTVENGFISISFLDEQFVDRKNQSEINSRNGKKGGRPKGAPTLENKPNANRTQSEDKAKQSNIEKKREEEEKNKRVNIKILEIENSQTWMEGIAMQNRINLKSIEHHLKNFLTTQLLKDEIDNRETKEIKSHFVSWVKIEIPKQVFTNSNHDSDGLL